MSGRRDIRRATPQMAPPSHHRMSAYLAGPMRGKQQQNAAEFADAAMALRASGWFIHSPSEYDIAAGMDLSTPDDEIQVAGLLRDDFKILCDCEAIIALPGWRKSVGSRIEMAVAIYSGLRTFELWRRADGQWALEEVIFALPNIDIDRGVDKALAENLGQEVPPC